MSKNNAAKKPEPPMYVDKCARINEKHSKLLSEANHSWSYIRNTTTPKNTQISKTKLHVMLKREILVTLG